jgi:hypothetical protein
MTCKAKTSVIADMQWNFPDSLCHHKLMADAKGLAGVVKRVLHVRQRW